MHGLKALGCRIAVDDFGTGFSSLAYLERLPVDRIKIDMQFVQRLTVDTARQSIAATTIELGNRLGLDVIAEGIETVDQHKLLRFLGCRYGQGFLYGRPMSATELSNWCSERRPGAALHT
jgi:EAL domain-containing protein (putative c-di-GMP-specific phosphodiesterase class I)